MDFVLIARLLIAHILGDFVLQPDSWVRQRNEFNFRSWALYVHALVQASLAWLFFFRIEDGFLALVIGSGHLIFDGLKARWRLHSLLAFVVDQSLHGLVILACWLYKNGLLRFQIFTEVLSNSLLWWLLAGVLLIIFVHPRLIALAVKTWRLDIPSEREPLYQAGRWIGIMERLLVFAFVLLGQYAAIGFILAAKSVFRFGDLRESKDKGHTEYVLVGTLLSFSLAIFTGIAFRLLLHLPAKPV
ncbi:MAG: DUF3307 domain-containing protein [Bacteroidetes bacterium]|nr:DUF3307 domain-containing protein [Bacteroidota bacterium]